MRAAALAPLLAAGAAVAAPSPKDFARSCLSPAALVFHDMNLGVPWASTGPRLAVEDVDRCEGLEALPASARAEAAYFGGRLRLGLGDFRGSAARFRRALELMPDHPGAHYGMAVAVRDRPDEALPFATRAAELAPSPRRRAEALRLQGEILLDLGKRSAAREAFEKALAIDADDLDALDGTARALADSPAQAREFLNRALLAADRSPEWLRPSAYRLVARAASELREAPLSLAALRRALALDADDVPALEALARLKKENPAAKPAEIPLATVAPDTKRAEPDPEDLETLRRAVESSRRGPQKAERAALRRFMEAAEGAPPWQQEAAYRFAALTWLELPDRDMARRCLWRSWDMNPLSLKTLLAAPRFGGVGRAIDSIGGAAKEASAADAYNVAVRARLDLGELDEAEASARKALALLPDSPRSLEAMVDVCLARGRLKEALEFSARAVKAAEKQAESAWRVPARVRRAAIESDLGDRAAAQASLRDALRLSVDPTEKADIERRLADFTAAPDERSPAPARSGN